MDCVDLESGLMMGVVVGVDVVPAALEQHEGSNLSGVQVASVPASIPTTCWCTHDWGSCCTCTTPRGCSSMLTASSRQADADPTTPSTASAIYCGGVQCVGVPTIKENSTKNAEGNTVTQ